MAIDLRSDQFSGFFDPHSQDNLSGNLDVEIRKFYEESHTQDDPR